MTSDTNWLGHFRQFATSSLTEYYLCCAVGIIIPILSSIASYVLIK